MKNGDASPKWIIGFSGLYHDSAAALVRDDEIICAVQEERFSRRKHDARFPHQALQYCKEQIPKGQSPDAIVFYENPVLSLDRVMQNGIQRAPRGGEIWSDAATAMLGSKVRVCGLAREHVDADEKVMTTEHHMSHAASAFYPSPFEEAAILTVDGVGEWATTTIAHGKADSILPLSEIRYPHSLGLLYSAFTEYCGLRVNSGEYKLMGLAPYGLPRFRDLILDHLIDLKPDGSFRLNTDYFGFMDTPRTTEASFDGLFGGPPLAFDGKLDFRHMDLAASIQSVIDEAMIRLVREALRVSGSRKLCLAGGVALNCVTNGRILRQVPELEGLWIQPASGDAGGALGAALYAAHQHFGIPRDVSRGEGRDSQKGSFLGPAFEADDIETALQNAGLKYHRPKTRSKHTALVAKALAKGRIIGRFDGPMEFGPRALGNRSILGDPRRKDAQRHINLRIKFRESWRPFAPSVLAERLEDCFDLAGESPYMMLVADVREDLRTPIDWAPFRNGDGDMLTFVNQERSSLPAITHVDYSARVQSVDAERNPGFHELLSAFDRLTGCPVLINTSFNVRGEPIVCRPEEAIVCFLNTGLDLLAIGDFIVWKHEQPEHLQEREGQLTYDPD